MESEEKKPAAVEMEGGGWNWWYVCEECHGAVDTKDKICPHCKSPLDWSGALWNRVSQEVSQ
jgi:rRNA maturation endonuclease Nob1